jgi:hypothetical protein
MEMNLDKIVFKRLNGFLSANYSIFSKQFGFVLGSSTECALFDLILNIQCSLDQRLRASESKNMCFDVFLNRKTHVSHIFHIKKNNRV